MPHGSRRHTSNACRVPVDLSTPERVRALKSQINDCCHNGLSFVAVDEDGAVVGFMIRDRFGWDAVGYGSVVLGPSRSVPDEFRELAEKDL
jgi:hypothetical protein